MSAQHEQQSEKSADDSLSADLQNAIDSAGGLITAYQETWAARFGLAKKEWALTKHAATMVAIIALTMSAIISSLWILVNVGIGSALHQNGLAIWAISLILIAVNIGLLVILWQAVLRLLGNIGFSRLLKTLSNDSQVGE